MSVLNDISVQDGLSIRNLASGVYAGNARRFLQVVRELKCHRMDSTEYSVDLKNDKSGAVELANAHWVAEDGRACWGLPSGNWKQFCDRVLKTESFWRGSKYMPTTKTEVSEQLSRDLLLATYVFPFHAVEAHADPIIEEMMIPMLGSLEGTKVHCGSAAVFKLISMASKDGESELSAFTRNTDQLCSFQAFSSFSTTWSVGTGTNERDVGPAIRRCQEVDWDMANEGKKFLRLAGLANYVSARMNACHPKSKTYRQALEMRLARLEDLEDAYLAKLENTYFEPDDPRDSAQALFNAGISSAIGTVTGADRFRCMAAGKVAIIRLDNHYFLLNPEDLKSLKFAAMGHSMWHVYAGSIKMEYATTEMVTSIPLNVPPEDRPVIKAAEDVAKMARQIIEDAGLATNLRASQEVVPFSVVKDTLDELWKWYTGLLELTVENGAQDCLGRYLSELFSVYTAKLGGDLMAPAINDMVHEIHEDYSRFGFACAYDLAQMIPLFRKLPESAIQDFGRFSKITPAYDVNPIYSFMDRAAKMQMPNPRGHATIDGLFGVNITEMTDEERDRSLDKLRSAARVMLAVSDVKQHALDGMTDEDRERYRDEPYTVILARLRAMARAVSTGVRTRLENDLHVPDGLVDVARQQAMELVQSGTMPTCEYAGAFLNVSSTMSYHERGDPDMAILRATSVIDGKLSVALSNLSGAPRATPTRLTDGEREAGSGTMITNYLLGKFPTRAESLAFVADCIPVASTSDKIETVKWPFKTRVITSMCGEGRRIQGEFEYNNGKVLVHVPGFMVGLNPADRLKRTYAAIRQDTSPGKIRLYGSLDLSSFSQGMHWDIQVAINDVLFDAYGLDSAAQKKLQACTLGTYMIRAEANLRLFTINAEGSNYEGLDGKRNTFMHCTMWYIARCEACRRGVDESMRSFIYIDDGAFAIELQEADLEAVVIALREALIAAYTEYGFKLNLSKTVLSTSYMQFLNELFLHGVHIGYGFRALCHTAAQSFPIGANVCEELAVIIGGIRGSGVAGGHSLRLLVGLNYIMWLYFAGVVGNKGRSLASTSAFVLSTTLYLPTIAGGFGMPNWTQVFSNLAGNRDAEKLDRIACMGLVMDTYFPDRMDRFEEYVAMEMLMPRYAPPTFIPDRVTITHPGTSRFGDLGRDMDIAKAALAMCTNPKAERLVRMYVESGGRPAPGGVMDMLVHAMMGAPAKLPMALVEKAMNTDSTKAVVTLVSKISSSYLIARVLKPGVIRSYDRKYRAAAKSVLKRATAMLL